MYINEMHIAIGCICIAAGLEAKWHGCHQLPVEAPWVVNGPRRLDMPYSVVDDGIQVGVEGIVHSILPVETHGSTIEPSFEYFSHNVQDLSNLENTTIRSFLSLSLREG